MELWDAYDAMGNKLDYTLVRDEPIPEGMHHLVVHIWYRNKNNELLIQRRALSRKLAPGIWAATGGSVVKGEDTILGLIRESEEEMGITPDVAKTMRVMSFLETDCLLDVYLVPFEGKAEDLHLQEEEVMDAKWISLEEFARLKEQPDVFWHYSYLDLLYKFLIENPAK